MGMRPFVVLLLGLALEAQPSDVTLRIATVSGQTQFRRGQLIPLELSFTRASPGKYSLFVGNADRWSMGGEREEFHVSPAAGAGDPLADYFHGGRAVSGPGERVRELTAEPVIIRRELNQWVRFDQPGRYRLHATSRRVASEERVVPIESNELAIDIAPADPAWSSAQLREVLQALRSNPSEQRSDAARRLWYLDTPASVAECARLLAGTDPQVGYLLHFCLLGASRRDEAAKTMRQLLVSPDQPVSREFLEMLAQIEAGSQTPIGSYPSDPAAQTVWREAWRRRVQAQTAITTRLQGQLPTVVERKQGPAKAVSLHTLLEVTASEAVPAALRNRLAELFFELPPSRQAALLTGHWKKIAGPAMIPVLRRICDEASPLLAEAIRRLYELDPTQGRRLLLDEMRRPYPRVPYSILTILPDRTLPDLDPALVENLERSPRKAAQHETSELIARYATPGILERVQAFYTHYAPACEPPLIAYFLRVAPTYGEQLLRQIVAERRPDATRCWAVILGETARYYVSPEWEKVAVDALQDPTVQVKIDAAQALGRYGSPAAAPLLWEAFRYWHDWWKTRPLEINQENRQVEGIYVRALSGANNWITTSEDFIRLRDLCLTAACRLHAEQQRRMRAQSLP